MLGVWVRVCVGGGGGGYKGWSKVNVKRRC